MDARALAVDVYAAVRARKRIRGRVSGVDAVDAIERGVRVQGGRRGCRGEDSYAQRRRGRRRGGGGGAAARGVGEG